MISVLRSISVQFLDPQLGATGLKIKATGCQSFLQLNGPNLQTLGMIPPMGQFGPLVHHTWSHQSHSKQVCLLINFTLLSIKLCCTQRFVAAFVVNRGAGPLQKIIGSAYCECWISAL